MTIVSPGIYHRDVDDKRTTILPGVWCDPCIAPLVAALNEGGVPTIASCCGHGKWPGAIVLADGRELHIYPEMTDRPPFVVGASQSDSSRHPEDLCEACGRPNIVWWVDSEEWNRATERGSILCPGCFVERWTEATGLTKILWELRIDPRSGDAHPPLLPVQIR